MSSNGSPGPDTRQALTSAGIGADPGLARQLSELARDLQAEPDESAVQQRIVEAVLNEVAGADAAGIMLISRSKVTTTAHTHALVVEVDHAQQVADDGPCLTSLRDQITVRVDDLTVDERWPGFARAAAGLGIRSMLSFQLFVEGDNLGALNIFSEQPKSFDDRAETAGLLLASHAAIAMKAARAEDNLRYALDSRDVIGQAKGILMERYRVNEQQAFDMLVVLSQRTHRKLRDIADDLAATGEIPRS